MAQEVEQTRPKQSLWRWSATSTALGTVVGLVLGAVYLGVFIVLLLAITASPSSDVSNNSSVVAGGLIAAMATLVLGLIIGVLPAAVIGGATGLAIGLALWGLRKWIVWPMGILVGLVVCLSVSVLAELTIWRSADPGVIYYIWRGVPTYIYVAAGGGMGLWLHSLLRRRAA